MFQNIFIHNGNLLPGEEASISLDNIEYSYGFGVYETIRVHKESLTFAEEHIERLMRSASIIDLDHPFDANSIHKWCEGLVKSCGGDRYNLKILLIGSPNPKDAQLFILPLRPKFPEKREYRNGVPVITYQYERPFPQAKTLNMLGSYIAFREAKKSDCYEALLVSKQGSIHEGTKTNFFVVQEDAIITPPTEHILEGITRKHILHVAKKQGIKVLEQEIFLSDLDQYNGAFLTSSSAKIMPINTIDNHVFGGVPEIVTELMKAYNELIAN